MIGIFVGNLIGVLCFHLYFIKSDKFLKFHNKLKSVDLYVSERNSQRDPEEMSVEMPFNEVSPEPSIYTFENDDVYSDRRLEKATLLSFGTVNKLSSPSVKSLTHNSSLFLKHKMVHIDHINENKSTSNYKSHNRKNSVKNSMKAFTQKQNRTKNLDLPEIQSEDSSSVSEEISFLYMNVNYDIFNIES